MIYHTPRKRQHTFHRSLIAIILLCTLSIIWLAEDTVQGQAETEVLQTYMLAPGLMLIVPEALMAFPAIAGVVYAVTKTPGHSKPDSREWAYRGKVSKRAEQTKVSAETLWAKERVGHHKESVRSWELHLFKTFDSVVAYQIYPGFCTPIAAMKYAMRIDGIKSWKVIKPSPLPCTNMLGLGAWGTP